MEHLIIVIAPVLIGILIFGWYVIDSEDKELFDFGSFENWLLEKIGLSGKDSKITSLIEKKGKVLQSFEEKAGVFEGKVRVSGEIFTATADGPLEVGAKVTVIA